MNGTTSPRRRGRPAGTVPIERDPRRFEIATFLMLRRRGLANYEAGRIALMFAGSAQPIEAALVAGRAGESPVLLELTAATDLAYARIDDRVATLVRRAKRHAGDLVNPDAEWCIRSVAAMDAAWQYFRLGDSFAVSAAMKQLLDLGWRDTILRARERYLAATGGPPRVHEFIADRSGARLEPPST